MRALLALVGDRNLHWPLRIRRSTRRRRWNVPRLETLVVDRDCANARLPCPPP